MTFTTPLLHIFSLSLIIYSLFVLMPDVFFRSFCSDHNALCINTYCYNVKKIFFLLECNMQNETTTVIKPKLMFLNIDCLKCTNPFAEWEESLTS